MVEVIREELPSSDLSGTRNSFNLKLPLARAQAVPFKFKFYHYQWTPEVRSSLHPQGVGVPS